MGAQAGLAASAAAVTSTAGEQADKAVTDAEAKAMARAVRRRVLRCIHPAYPARAGWKIRVARVTFLLERQRECRIILSVERDSVMQYLEKGGDPCREKNRVQCQ